jgi:CheY-like chemotaxis protein
VWVLALPGVVQRAGGGREAIDRAMRDRPDLIILDLMMPGVSGFDVAEALQKRPDTANIPILVVTAKEVTSDDRRRLNGYVMAIVEKTVFDRERFGAEVRRAMSGRMVAV